MKDLLRLVATFFYAGEVPLLPGTAGSFVGALLFLAVSPSLKLTFFVLFLVIFLGFLTAGPAQKIYGVRDPHPVVIDEVAGIFLTYLMLPLSASLLIIGFLLFRLLDIAKPFPARRLERLTGSPGIILDDLVCGIYANLLLRALLKYHILV